MLKKLFSKENCCNVEIKEIEEKEVCCETADNCC